MALLKYERIPQRVVYYSFKDVYAFHYIDVWNTSAISWCEKMNSISVILLPCCKVWSNFWRPNELEYCKLAENNNAYSNWDLYIPLNDNIVVIYFDISRYHFYFRVMHQQYEKAASNKLFEVITFIFTAKR